MPLPLDLIERVTDRWRKSLLPFDDARWMRAAARVTGLDDFGDDPAFYERYARCMESLRSVDFGTVGRAAARTMMVWHLTNRLNAVEALKQHPEALERDVDAPIVVLGLFRTGTTFLHNVLAADPDNRAGTMWEVSYPIGRKRDPLGDVKWRRRRTKIPLTMNHVIVPDQDVVHYVDIDTFEEDFFMLGTDMLLMTQFIGLGDWDYGWAIHDTDVTSAYRWHRRQMQLLDLQSSAQRWVMKCPWHLWNLRSLLDVYPKARVVHIHRNPVKAVGSHCSLTGRIVARIHRNLDLRTVGTFWRDYSAAGLEAGQRAKNTLPPEQLVDVRLRDLRTAPGESIRAIYAQFGIPCDDELVAAFDARAAEDPTFQHGVHEYDLADYGLTEEGVRARFAEYGERFGV